MVKDSLGCTADTTYVLAEPAGASVELGPDQTIQYGEVVELMANSSSNISAYDWFEADTCTQCSSIIVRPSITTTYVVQVEDENGCFATDEVIISVIGAKDVYIPNVFSPNGDNVNDILYIAENPGISSILLFEIFDRWGTLVFRQADFPPGDEADGWDGSYNGQILNPGVFTCRLIVRFLDGTVDHVTGDATLIR
jgi:gliding motility-associated-like protein